MTSPSLTQTTAALSAAATALGAIREDGNTHKPGSVRSTFGAEELIRSAKVGELGSELSLIRPNISAASEIQIC